MSANKGPRERFTLRLPSSLYAKILVLAQSQGLDANSFICSILEREVNKGTK